MVVPEKWRPHEAPSGCQPLRAALTFSFHVVDGVGDDLVGIVKRLLPGQQDGGAGDGLGVSVSGRAGPVLRHDHDEASQGQHGALLALCQALIDGIILGDDLSYHQFTAETGLKHEYE